MSRLVGLSDSLGLWDNDEFCEIFGRIIILYVFTTNEKRSTTYQ